MMGMKMINRKSILAMTTACLYMAVSVAQAEVVTLRSLDESTAMSGTIVGFDGDVYQLETSVGTISLAASQVTCEGEGCPDLVSELNEYAIAGSNSIGVQLMPQMIEAYAFELGANVAVEAVSAEQVKYTITDADGEVNSVITVNSSDSRDAFAALESREAYIGLSTRRANSSDQNRFLQAGKGDLMSPEQERVLALDGMVVAVNPSNPIRTLSLNQISDIFAGNVSNWREVGGVDAAINVYRRDGNAGATQVFEKLVMAPMRRVIANTAFIMDNNSAVSDAVAQDLNGIGLTTATEERNAKVLSLRSVCEQISAPSEFSIKTEDYPIARRLYLYTTNGSIPDKAVEFIEFATSDAAQEIVEQTGFVSQNVTAASLNDQGRRLAHALTFEQDRESLALLQEMVAGLIEAERLSLTFRFQAGSDLLDNRAATDIGRLADMLKNGEFDGKQLMIIGFSDNTGDSSQSQTRAESIRDILVEAAGAAASAVELTALGYGKISPLGCNETENGRGTNRRVEIWVR